MTSALAGLVSAALLGLSFYELDLRSESERAAVAQFDEIKQTVQDAKVRLASHAAGAAPFVKVAPDDVFARWARSAPGSPDLQAAIEGIEAALSQPDSPGGIESALDRFVDIHAGRISPLRMARARAERAARLASIVVALLLFGLLLMRRGDANALKARLRSLEQQVRFAASGKLPPAPPVFVNDEIGRISETIDLRARELARETERYRTAMRAARVEVFEITPEANEIVMLSRHGVSRHLGLPEAETPQTLDDWMSRVHAGDVERIKAILSLQSDQEQEIEFRFVSPAGEVIWVQARVTYYGKLEGGRGQGATQPLALRRDHGFFLGVLMDVTERVEVAAQLRRARDLAEEALRAKVMFTSRMSHEIRTPLNAIVGFAEVLAEDPSAASKQRERAEHIRNAGRILTRLVNDALDFENLRGERLKIIAEPSSGEAVVREVVDLMGPLAQDTGCAIEVSADPSPPVVVDRQRLRQILQNLVSNALKYGGGNAPIEISCGAKGRYWFLRVRDHGPGMSESACQKIFEPFERLPEHEKVGGWGLGLAISRSLAERMNGTLTAQSAPTSGTTFTLQLPLAQDAVAQKTLRLQRFVAPRGMKVLYIEDEPVNRKVMQALLSAVPGVALHCHDRAAGALELVRVLRPSLIFLDLHLPDGSGEGILEAIRADTDLNATPVVVASADVMPSTEQRLRGLGADDFVPKPFSREAILEQLARAAAFEAVAV